MVSAQVGCAEDADCQTGLFCNTALAQPACQDINECDISNVVMNGTAYCGNQFTYCYNYDGSFSCPCSSGYTAHTPWVG